MFLVFTLALLSRLTGLDEATTEDEDQWMSRSGGFAQALASAAWRGTYQTGHPGVTTMWLANVGLGPTLARHFGPGRSERIVTNVADFRPALHAARLPFVVVNSLLVVACGFLATRLFGIGPGLVGGLLLALEPYWCAMSPLVAMDALLSGFTTASLLSGILAFRGPTSGVSGERAFAPAPVQAGLWAALSGYLAGLALLTKGSAVFLIPMVPLLALREWWQAPDHRDANKPTKVKLVIWVLGLVAAAALWPAMWADPLGTVRRTAEFVRGAGTSPHAPGSFFLGQPVGDPGPFFYPVALALHLGPGTFVGLVALALLARRAPRPWRGHIPLLLIFVLIFGLGLTLATKKIDRYLLPLIPTLGILAGLGWWMLLAFLAPRLRDPLVVPFGLVLLGQFQAWPLGGAGQHPLAAYNPLFGGIKAAELAIPVGWGEGLDYVGAYLEQQPEADRLVTAIWYPLYLNFQAHAPGRVVNVTFNGSGQVSNQRLLDQADLYVDYVHVRQRGLVPSVVLDRAPDFVVSISNVEYARVYRLRNPAGP